MRRDRIAVKPARPGMGLTDPQSGRPIPDEGTTVPDNARWRARIKRGVVVKVDPKKVPQRRKQSAPQDRQAAPAENRAATAESKPKPEPRKAEGSAKKDR